MAQRNKNHIRDILAAIKRADESFNLIEEGDRIVLGISGGKDSIVLFYAMTLYQKFSNKNFTIFPVMLDLGFSQFDASNFQAFFRSLGHELIIADSRQVAPILEIQKEKQGLSKLPCSICSRMKKAGINKEAKTLGANKVAFAHHVDDALETLLMNMISGGRFALFSPKMHLSNADITFIRPLIFVEEDTIKETLKELNLPIMGSACPNDKKTRREDIKQLLNNIYEETPEAKKNFQLMLTNYQNSDLWFDKLSYPLGDGLTVSPVTSQKQTTEMLKIRFEVFVLEQHCSLAEEIEEDEDTYQAFVLYKDNKAIGTIRYKEIDTNTVKVGRFALLKDYRNKGYGTKLISFIEQSLFKRIKPLHLVLGAQRRAESYYAKLGYVAYGEEYMDANIPHIHMRKTIE